MVLSTPHEALTQMVHKPYSNVGHFNGVNDVRLKIEMLRSIISEHLPKDNRLFWSLSELPSILSHVKIHMLLSEQDTNPEVMEDWRSTVDEWVDRLISLISSSMPDKCWVGVHLLGVTCESCTSHRFLASYSLWFQKLLSTTQSPSGTQLVRVASCASLADLLTRLCYFPSAKKDATSLAGKLIQHVLNLLNVDNAEAVWEGAIDLLCTIIKTFPSAIYRHYDSVEVILVSNMLRSKSNSNLSKKSARCLSLLPNVRSNEDSWSLLMQRILISVHALLNDAFQGLEEEAKSLEIMRKLVPPGKDSPPPLGGQLIAEPSKQAAKRLPGMLIPQVSILMHCCCMMLTNPYPIQVTVPIQHLLALIERVLRVDGTLNDSSQPFTTAMHQVLLCTELPALHLDSLDLLHVVIKGVRSQLLPHAASIVRLLTEYFREATLPSIRTKMYLIMQTLLIGFGVGMALCISQEVVNNAFLDLNDYSGSGATFSSTQLSKSTSDTFRRGSCKKRKHEQLNGIDIGAEALDKKTSAPLSVKIAALNALNALLTVGGSIGSECWRSDVDSLLENIAEDIAEDTCGVGWAGEGKHLSLGDESTASQADFQLAALEALLASLLSPAYDRPQYLLSQGLKLFHRGKLETGTRLAAFCAHALNVLGILIHPRSLPLMDDASFPKYSALDEGHQKFNPFSCSRGDIGNVNDDDDDDDDLYRSWLGNEPATEGNNNITRPSENQEPSLRASSRENMQIADVEMASASVVGNVERHQERALVAIAEVSNKEDARFTSGSSLGKNLADASAGFLPGSPSTSDAVMNVETGNGSECLGTSLEDQPPSYDSDSTSIGSLPDIVDADPDSDD